MNKRGEWDPGTLLRIKSILVCFFVERVVMVFSNHPVCAFFCVCFMGVLNHSKEGWQFASFEILIKQSADHVFRADLIECRRNWFNWWAGWWCRLKFYSILSIEIQTYQPRAALCTSPCPLKWGQFLISMPIEITVEWPSPSVFLVSILVRMGGESSVERPMMTHTDPWWFLPGWFPSLSHENIPGYSRMRMVRILQYLQFLPDAKSIYGTGSIHPLLHLKKFGQI